MACTALVLQEKQMPGENILIYRLGSLGDTVIALPAFHLIRQAFPKAHISVLTNHPVSAKAAPLAAVLENTGLIDDLLAYPIHLRTWSQFRSLRAEIASRKFQLAISLAPARGLAKSIRDYIFFRWCGIRRIVGIPMRRLDLAELPEPGTDRHEWEAKRLLRRLRPLGVIDLNEDRWWSLCLTGSENQCAEGLLAARGITRPFLTLSVGTKVDVNDWGVAKWRELVDRLNSEFTGFGLVACGSADDEMRSQELLNLWDGPSANLCGQCAPRVTAAVFRRACLFIGHDSGPMHLAACVGTPCVAIFSARNFPGRWFPRGDNHSVIYYRTPCAGCGLEFCTQQKKKCITSITVDEVLSAVRLHLDQSAATGPFPTISLIRQR